MTVQRDSNRTAEPAAEPIATAREGPSSAVDPALLMQILSAEQSSLTASRSLGWNEAFARASMYLSALAGATVALALVGQQSGFGSNFVLFALLILPVVILVGESTVIRLGFVNMSDATYAIGLNRIRGAYLEIAPELRRLLVTSGHDDPQGIGVTMGVHRSDIPALHIIASTPFLIGTINAVVLAVFVSTVALQLHAERSVAVVVGIVAAVLSVVVHGAVARRQIATATANMRPIFPSSPG